MKMVFSFLLLVFSLIYAPAAHAVLWGQDGIQSKEYVYDFAVDGGASGASIDLAKGAGLPSGAHLLDVYYYMQTAFTSDGSAVVALGDAASSGSIVSATAYNNSAYTLAALNKDSAGQPRVCSSTSCKPLLSITGAALTAGKVKIHYVYVVPSGR